MSRIKTYPITGDQLDDLIKALDADREKLAKICGTKKSAIGWWRHQERIPITHLSALMKALDRRFKSRSNFSPVEQRARVFVNKVCLALNASGNAAPQAESSFAIEEFYGTSTAALPNATGSASVTSGKVPHDAHSIDLSRVSTDELLSELRRRIEPKVEKRKDV